MIFEPLSINLEETVPGWLLDNPLHQACVLSDRIAAAEMGRDWDWRGLTEKDFTGGLTIETRNHYPVIFKAMKWLERMNEPCLQASVCYIADQMGSQRGITGLPSRVRFIHKISYYMDKLWTLLTLDPYDHIGTVKEATRRREVAKDAYELLENVTGDMDYYLRRLGKLESVKSRIERPDYL